MLQEVVKKKMQNCENVCIMSWLSEPAADILFLINLHGVTFSQCHGHDSSLHHPSISISVPLRCQLFHKACHQCIQTLWQAAREHSVTSSLVVSHMCKLVQLESFPLGGL